MTTIDAFGESVHLEIDCDAEDFVVCTASKEGLGEKAKTGD
jgi:hypothetical protein